jgi:hypothetical protein
MGRGEISFKRNYSQGFVSFTASAYQNEAGTGPLFQLITKLHPPALETLFSFWLQLDQTKRTDATAFHQLPNGFNQNQFDELIVN